ncbi:MAG TPA: hypothetical protein PLU79_02335 [Burkholderiaceae bacterium]|nr:hypothetical protein [Burkholderiaceae bacterium]
MKCAAAITARSAAMRGAKSMHPPLWQPEATRYDPSAVGKTLRHEHPTIRILLSLDSALAQASAPAHVTKSELVRRAVAAYLASGPDRNAELPGPLELAGDRVGCFSGGPDDLASTPRHSGGFGQR